MIMYNLILNLQCSFIIRMLHGFGTEVGVGVFGLSESEPELES